LGGASYEPTENPLHWPKIFTTKAIPFTPFTPSNVGYEVGWTPAFLKEAEGLPLKDIVLTTHKGKRQGELVITRYGIEGTPVYFVGTPGPALIDLKPGLTAEAVLGKLKAVKENLSPNRRIKKQLGLSPAAQALVFHLMPRAILEDRSLIQLAHTIKAFPIELLSPRPLEEAISSKGGVSMKALDERLMLKKYPGIFLAGEMLDWDAPTGGFLIQGCVTQGFCAGLGINHYLKSPRPTS
jgi:predicted flavoprotein YhiN